MNKINWTNTLFLLGTPVLTILGLIYHIQVEGFEPWFLIFALIAYAFTGMSITGGYHRYFAHKTYKAKLPVKLFYLIFGAAALENSVLEWASDHRNHHKDVDTDNDPYNIRRGFFYAHIGWIFLEDKKKDVFSKDLLADPLVMWQHRNYLLIAMMANVFMALIPFFIFGKIVGAFSIVMLLRICWVHHATFFVNSLAHVWGSQPYDKKQTAKDNLLVSLVAWGEGYHNFHHAFQSDYRNGIKWYHFDPTKWLIKTLEKCGLTFDLKRASDLAILKARLSVKMQNLQIVDKKVQDFKKTVETKFKELERIKKEYNSFNKNLKYKNKEKLKELKKNMKIAKIEFQYAYGLFISKLYAKN